jgi:hypothetical protein
VHREHGEERCSEASSMRLLPSLEVKSVRAWIIAFNTGSKLPFQSSTHPYKTYSSTSPQPIATGGREQGSAAGRADTQSRFTRR